MSQSFCEQFLPLVFHVVILEMKLKNMVAFQRSCGFSNGITN